MRSSDLSIRALHRLDTANSWGIRHSIVEACFYNLRVLAQELPRRPINEEFLRKLREALDNLDDARELTEEYFAYQVRRGLTVADLFPEQSRTIEQSLRELEALAADGPVANDGDVARREWADGVVGAVDALLGAIDDVKESVRRLKTPIGDVMEEVVSIHRATCAEQGVSLQFEDDSDSRTQVFARRRALLNAVGELVVNALRHAFRGSNQAPKWIKLRLEVDPETRDTIISVCDNGCGMTQRQLRAVGTAGASRSGGGDGIAMVRRIIEGDHLGVVSFQSTVGEGTCVRVRLPRRAEPDLEPEPVPPAPAVEKPPVETASAGPGPGLLRVIVALLVFLALAALGAAGAWYMLRLQKDQSMTVAADGSGDFARISEARAGRGGAVGRGTAGESHVRPRR